MQPLTNIEFVTNFNGILATIAGFVILLTIWRTCRFTRKTKLQDCWATIFQDIFHLSLFCAVFMISVDHLTEMCGVRNLLTEYLSPPLSDFFISVTAFSWSGYKIRKNWFQRKGFNLSEDLRVIKKENDETIDPA